MVEGLTTHPTDDTIPHHSMRSWSRRRKEWTLVVVAVLGLSLLALKPADDGFSRGPLASAARPELRVPMTANDEGVLWGDQVLLDTGTAPVVLETVTLVPGSGKLTPIGGAFVWAQDRAGIAGTSKLAAFPLPIPQEWGAVPRHEVEGFEIEPASQLDRSGEPDLGVELVFQFSPPTTVSSIKAIVVTYRVGQSQYKERFDSLVTVCPPSASQQCQAADPQ